jgi:hypothetical protein
MRVCFLQCLFERLNDRQSRRKFRNKIPPFIQIFTYVVVGLGFALFFSGLIGWVGGASESPCLVRLFLIAAILAIVAEIGGIITLNVVKLEVSDLATLNLRNGDFLGSTFLLANGARQYDRWQDTRPLIYDITIFSSLVRF